MKVYEKIIDYIIEQADRNDLKNLQFEQDILFLISRENDMLYTRVLSSINGFKTLLEMQNVISHIQRHYEIFYNVYANIIGNKYYEYVEKAYNNTNDLIELGKELDDKFSKVQELQNVDVNTIKYIRDHSFEMIKGYNNRKIDQIRSILGDLYLNGKSDKATVRERVQKILDVDRSKAEEIAQTELSRAYNYGTLSRLQSYAEQNPEQVLKKYWHGFKFSVNTCTYCRPRIGQVFDLYDNSETLPAHVRCRCVWLPIFDGWDQPISRDLTRRANMMKMAYNPEQLYARINSRLGIDYGSYINKDVIASYLNGNRSDSVMRAIANGRKSAISDTKSTFDIALDMSKGRMSAEFNNQIGFWKNLVSSAIIDKDADLLFRSYEAIKGVMVLPWNNDQMAKWNELLRKVGSHI